MESSAAEQVNPGEEYRALTTTVGILDCSSAGKLEVSGKNAIPFLNGLTTVDLKLLHEGRGTLSAFLNVHGKVLALARIYHRSPGLLLELHSSNGEKIFHNLSRFVPAGDFEIRDITGELGLLSLQGPRAELLLRQYLPEDFNEDAHSTTLTSIDGIEVFAARHSRIGSAGVDLFVRRQQFDQLLKTLTAAAVPLEGRTVSQGAVDIARIDAGIPVEPNEVNEDHILLEAGLDEAVSYTKGCYLGQEIIARIHWRGQPARRVRRLALEASTLPPRGAELLADDGKRVGELTSTAIVPAGPNSRMVALGYVHRYYLTEGTRFVVRVNEAAIGNAEIS